MYRSRILFGAWILFLLILFFYKGQPAVSALLVFTAAYLAASFLLTRVSGRKLTVRCGGGDMVSKGETMTMTIELKNRGRLPVFFCTCEAKRFPISCSLLPGGSRRFAFDLTDQYCGKVELKLTELMVCDPLQLFTAKRLGWSGQKSSNTEKGAPAEADRSFSQEHLSSAAAGYFAPQLNPAQIPEAFLDSYNMESYQYSQYEKGSDPGEVFGVREYQEGDSLKQIHWKLTAKLGEITVKIPSYPIENNILMILDNLLDPEADVPPEQRSALVELLYSLSDALLEKSISHSIGWYDSREQVFIRRQIRSEEELWASVPEVLGCGFEKSEVSTIYRYLESAEGADFTNHFLVTAQAEKDTERLESYGAVNVFRTIE